MTIEEVEAKVKEIAAMRGFDETAHEMEDDLREDVLRAIANGAENPSGLAAAALKTSELPFARWYG